MLGQWPCLTHHFTTLHPSLTYASPIPYLRLTHYLPTPHPSLIYASPITYLGLIHHLSTPHPSLTYASPITYLRLTHHLSTPHPSLIYASPITCQCLTQPLTNPLYPSRSLFLASIFFLFASLIQFSLSVAPIKSLFMHHALIKKKNKFSSYIGKF
jgi:hypothetical protein